MALFSLLAAFLLEQFRPVGADSSFVALFRRYANLIERNFNAGSRGHGAIGWALAVGGPVVAALLLYWVVYRIMPLLAWGMNVAVLYFTVSLRQVGQPYATISEALRNDDLRAARSALESWTGVVSDDLTTSEVAKLAIEHRLLSAHRNGFGAILWFLVLPGPTGALLYRFSSVLDETWGTRRDEEFGAFGEFARKAYELLDWVPARITAASFAVAGDFEDAIYCWRTQAMSWMPKRQGILLASAAGAMGVRLGDSLRQRGVVIFRPEVGTGDEADVDYMQTASGLVWRVLALWMLLLLLVSIANWVG